MSQTECVSVEQVVRSYFDEINRLGLAAAIAAMRDDTTWWSPSGVIGKKQMVAVCKAIEGHMAQPIKFEIL